MEGNLTKTYSKRVTSNFTDDMEEILDKNRINYSEINSDNFFFYLHGFSYLTQLNLII